MKKGFINIILALIFAAAVAVGLGVWKTSQTSMSIENAEVSDSEVVVGTSDWKRLQEWQDVILVYYPSDWEALNIDGHKGSAVYISPYEYHSNQVQPQVVVGFPRHYECEGEFENCRDLSAQEMLQKSINYYESTNHYEKLPDTFLKSLNTKAISYKTDFDTSLSYLFIVKDKYISVTFEKSELLEKDFIEMFLVKLSQPSNSQSSFDRKTEVKLQ